MQGCEELLYTCQLELDFGPMDLDKIFHCYFDTDIEELKEESTQDIVVWSSTIQRAQEQSDFIYHNHDRISDLLCQWVGLSMETQYCKDTKKS